MGSNAPSQLDRSGLVAALDAVIVVADGLVLLAVATGIVGLTMGGTDSALFELTIGTVYAWATTPGAGVIELLAYATIAVVVLGPAWHWLLDVAAAGDAAAEADRGPDPFEFSPKPSGDRPASERPSLANGGAYRSAQSPGVELSLPDWTTELFGEPRSTIAVPEGDFLRSASDSTGETDGEESTADAGSEESTKSAYAADSTGDATNSHPFGSDDARAESDGEPVTTASEPAFRTDEPTAPGAETAAPDEGLEASDEPSTIMRPDRVADVVADARETAGAVEDALARAIADSGVEPAAAALATSDVRADAALRELRSAFPNDDDVPAETVAAARERGRHIESALERLDGHS